MADGQLAAELDEIRGGITLASELPMTFDVRRVVHLYAPRLVAAVDKALEHHQRVPLYGNAATEGEPGNCPHDPDDERWHFEPPEEPGEWLCQGRPEGAVCSACTDGPGGDRADWPCDEYVSIFAALTGRDFDTARAALAGDGKEDG